MQKFIIKELVTKNIEPELERIGFDIAYRSKAKDKFLYKTFKIFDLTLPQANILKQTALSFGADCGVHREVLTSNIEKTDAILGGSFSQIKKICEKLKLQPFSMKTLAEKILSQLEKKDRTTKLVGILNITPDSFSDGGKFLDAKDAKKYFYQLIEDGADIIDIGAESTKPHSQAVDAKTQIERLKPILLDLPDFPVSIDTKSSEVAKFALDNGVKIINDVSGLDFDTKMIDTVASYNATIIIQHSTPRAEDIIIYNDVVEEVYMSLLNKINLANTKGVNKIILDVGIGFGKSKENNLELLDRIEEFYSLKYPLMVGISRKSFLGIKENNNEIKDALSATLAYPLIKKGVDFLRVHNVKLHRQLLDSVI